MRRMIADGKVLVDQLGDAAPGPDITQKATCFGALFEQSKQLSELSLVKQWCWARRRVVKQSLCTAQAGTFEPLANSSLGNTQSLSYALLGPA